MPQRAYSEKLKMTEQKKKQFLFLYPIKDYFDIEIERDRNLMDMSNEKFRNFYNKLLNDCISKRYRERGFSIGYVTFDDRPVEIVKLNKADLIIKNGCTFDFHLGLKAYPLLILF